MNIEEAIHELQEDKMLYETEVCHAGDGSPDGRLLEALDMAIEALSADTVSRDVYDKRTKADEEIIDSYREKLANCHKEILRLLDFNDITESPNDVIERQNDVIEVVRCKDCKWYMLTDHNETEVCTNKQWDISMAVYPIISADDYCSYGERREE